ncbi:helix-turn-helix transcriptional regulator [Aestuariivita boseongensis]|uniref:helix-turn-helix transcriptional regulator n=1 Tax=Aestuariivita boseongensis TaxID=1470562 RepID=UPI0012FADC33|nr:transcriptional regulator [Aestuariivita boseongensis]
MKRYITLAQLQEKLGHRSRSSIIRDYKETGLLPAPIKLGARLYWSEAEVDAAIEAKRD